LWRRGRVAIISKHKKYDDAVGSILLLFYVYYGFSVACLWLMADGCEAVRSCVVSAASGAAVVYQSQLEQKEARQQK
jgi:hypothetical protein